MSARLSRLLPLLPLILLGACAPEPTQIAKPVPAFRTAGATAAERRAEIKRQIAKVCPAKMTPAELDQAADVVERYKGDADVVALVNRIFRFDTEARICRGVS